MTRVDWHKLIISVELLIFTVKENLKPFIDPTQQCSIHIKQKAIKNKLWHHKGWVLKAKYLKRCPYKISVAEKKKSKKIQEAEHKSRIVVNTPWQRLATFQTLFGDLLGSVPLKIPSRPRWTRSLTDVKLANDILFIEKMGKNMVEIPSVRWNKQLNVFNGEKCTIKQSRASYSSANWRNTNDKSWKHKRPVYIHGNADLHITLYSKIYWKRSSLEGCSISRGLSV